MMAPTDSAKLFLLALVATCCCSIMVASWPWSGENSPSGQLPALFNFTRYQTLYDKHYSGRVEEMTRKIYFWSSVLQVYLSSWAYKVRRSSHYLALNDMSDWSRRELDLMVNKVLAGERRPRASAHDEVEVILQEARSEQDLEEVAEQFEETIKDELAEVKLLSERSDQLMNHRKKRSVKSQTDQTGPAARKYSINMLIQNDGQPPEQAEQKSALAKLGQYFFGADERPVEKLQLIDAWELLTPGKVLLAQTSSVARRNLVSRPQLVFDGQKNPLEKLHEIVAKSQREDDANFDPAEESPAAAEQNDHSSRPDEMFVDLRESGCLLEPRRQSKCGSCYAFASIALAEFLFCKQTDRLYAFSEQYLLDCGKGRVKLLEGCEGGADLAVALFVHNFGLELRDLYPYKARELKCPYEQRAPLNSTGFMRMQLHDLMTVPVEAWPAALKLSPILVGFAVSENFHLYGGGVDSGEQCGEVDNHTMLLVGHGRENGQEFWLVRNSFGTKWGEGGYYKLAKSAPSRCHNKEGVVWATHDAVHYHARVWPNELNKVAQRALRAAQRA